MPDGVRPLNLAAVGKPEPARLRGRTRPAHLFSRRRLISHNKYPQLFLKFVIPVTDFPDIPGLGSPKGLVQVTLTFFGAIPVNTAISSRPDREYWKALYTAAILETDRTVIPRRVAEGEAAAVARARELFYTAATADEQDALEDALYALRALKTALQHAEAA